jgi:hypothetical protein
MRKAEFAAGVVGGLLCVATRAVSADRILGSRRAEGQVRFGAPGVCNLSQAT